MGGHRAMLDFLAERAGYARAGHHGGGAGRWVDAHDWTTAQFLQHDSREHDPQLHVHGPTANKTVCADGTVRALDFSLILQWKDAAGAYADRWVEAYVWREAGVRWTPSADGTSRQVAGIDADATNLFSKRTAAIGPAMEKLVARFRADTGREPNNRERAELADRASNLTKAAKEFGAETRDGQLARWAAEYDAAFGANVARLAQPGAGAGAGRGGAVVGAGHRHPGVGGDGGHPPVLDPLEPDDRGGPRPPGPPRASGPSSSNRCWRG